MQLSIEEVQSVKLPNFEKDTKELAASISLYALSKIQKRIESNIQPANSPLTIAVKGGSNTLKGMTGNLRASLHAMHTTRAAIVATNVPYARILNDGGIITPKNSKHLALPATYSIAKHSAKYRSVKDAIEALRQAGYSVYRPKKRNSSERSNVIMCKKDKNAKPFVAYILKKEIVIPKREYMTLTKDELDQIEKMTEAYYAK